MNKAVLAILFVVVLAMVATLWQGDKYKKFMETAAKTTGRITQKEDRLLDPTKRQAKEHWLHYTYTDKNGMEYNKQDRIEFDDLWVDLKESYPIDIYYNPEKPAESYPSLLLERRMGIASKLKK